MNLYKIYHDICNRGHERGVKRMKGFELHHIHPKSLGGLDIESNYALLTPKEHYVVHHCLARTGNGKMSCAFWRMVHSKGQNSHRITSKEYENLRDIKIKFDSEVHKGKPKSQEHKDKIRNSSLGKVMSLESRKLMSLASKGRPKSKDSVKKRAESNTKYMVKIDGVLYSLIDAAIKFNLNIRSFKGAVYNKQSNYKEINFTIEYK